MRLVHEDYNADLDQKTSDGTGSVLNTKRRVLQAANQSKTTLEPKSTGTDYNRIISAPKQSIQLYNLFLVFVYVEYFVINESGRARLISLAGVDIGLVDVNGKVAKRKPRGRPRAGFKREAPQDRRKQLAEATLRCIVKHGNAGVSARQIAVEAGVTQGLITHHFGEINELVAYAFDLMSDELLAGVMKAVDEAQPDPKSRLAAFVENSFSTSMFDRDVLGVWVVFWGLILHSPRMSASQKDEYTSYVATVEELIIEYAAVEGFPLANPRLAAIGFTALMDGLWLAWCLNPEAFKPAEGIQICNHWIEGLRRGAHE